MNSFSDFEIKTTSKAFEGEKIKITKILNRDIEVHAFSIEDSKCFNGKCLKLQISWNGEKRIVFTSAGMLIEQVMKVPENGFPFTARIIEENERYKFI